MFGERLLNFFETQKIPNTYWKNKTYEYQYWFRSLYQKIYSSLIFKGLPESWPKDFFLDCIFMLGFVGVFKSERFGDEKDGMAFQPCFPSGYDFYYEPTRAIVSNPLFTKEFDVHKNIEFIRLTPDFCGIIDIIDYYATKLAEISKGIDMGLINAKIPLIIHAENEAQAQTVKAIYDKVQAGETLITWKDLMEEFDEVMPHKDPFESWTNDYKSTYIVPELLENMRTILDSFYTEIGLPVAIEKKSHALDQEADFMAAQSQARIACWVQCLEESFKNIEKLFGVKWGVEYARDEQNQDDVNGSRRVSEQDGRY